MLESSDPSKFGKSSGSTSVQAFLGPAENFSLESYFPLLFMTTSSDGIIYKKWTNNSYLVYSEYS